MSDLMTRTLERSDDPQAKLLLLRHLERQGMTRGEAIAHAYGFGGTEVGERETDLTYPRIVIDGERFHVTDTNRVGFGDLVEIETEEGEAFILSEDAETAGAACAERWREMAEHDPSEFAAIVGEQTLVSWALGQYAGPGSHKVRSLQEWLDLVADHPEEEWANYDGNEREVDRVGKLAAELGFVPTVAYRSN